MSLALKHSLFSAWQPPDRRPIWQWAQDNVSLPPAFTRHGPFKIERERHFIFPLECLQDDRVREVNIMAPVRGGKSLLAMLWVPWTLANDPGPVRWVCQSDRVAKEDAELRIMPMIRSVKSIQSLMPGGDRERTQEIIFSNGVPLYIQGPGIKTLQTKGYRYIVADEPWQYVNGIISEIKGRVGDFLILHTSKILFISQGGAPDSEWDEQFKAGELYDWHVECQKCNHFMPASFFGARADGTFWGIRWDKLKLANGDWDVAKSAATARFECQKCGHPHVDGGAVKSEWNRTGRYIRTREMNPRSVSIRWGSPIFYPWADLVEKWLHACNARLRGNLEPLIAFHQKYVPECKDEQGVLQTTQQFARVKYEVNSAWPDEVVRFMSIDRQQQHVYWWTVRAWAKGGRSRRLGFGKAFGRAELEKIRDDFKVEPCKTLIDSSYEPRGDHGVYAICFELGWVWLRGEDKAHFFHDGKRNGKPYSVARSYSEKLWGDPESGKTRQGRRRAPGMAFAKPTLNGRVQGLIDAGLWEEPITEDTELEREYAIQMAGRIRKVFYDEKTGRSKVVWWESKRDHARDLANMQTVGATLAEILPDTLDSISEQQAQHSSSQS